MVKILFTICGRAGSKGIKNKNIKMFCGIPLPYYTLSAIDLFIKETNLKINTDIVANTDSAELLKMICNNSMQEVHVIERTKLLSDDNVAKIDVVRDCMEKMQEKMSKKYDIILDLDLTSPLRTSGDIERVIEKHIEKSADVTTTITTARRNPYFNQVKKVEHGFKKVLESNYTARQQAPEIFDMNASIYAYSPKYLGLKKGVLDGYCECVEMYDTGILDLDHENDFQLMQVIAEYLFEKNTKYQKIKENAMEIWRASVDMKKSFK